MWDTAKTRAVTVASASVSPSARCSVSCSSLLALEALSEDLDVMERSPNLPLHFADENLEPSASCGLNAFVDHFTVAMKRSTSPNTGSKSGPN